MIILVSVMMWEHLADVPLFDSILVSHTLTRVFAFNLCMFIATSPQLATLLLHRIHLFFSTLIVLASLVLCNNHF